MGSWNATCQISQLPITPGTPVKVLFLQRNQWSMDPPGELRLNDCNDHARERCCSADWWFPRSLPIRAYYDDYGRVRVVHQKAAKLVFDQLHHDFVSIDGNPSSDMDWERLWDLAVFGKLRVNANASSFGLDIDPVTFKPTPIRDPVFPVPVCGVMVREDVWTSLLKMSSPRGSFQGIRASIVDRVTDMGFMLDPNDLLSEGTAERILWDYHRGMSRTLINMVNQKIPFKDATWDGLAGIVHVDGILNRYLRKSWGPQSGVGSQAQDFDACLEFYSSIVGICRRKNRR